VVNGDVKICVVEAIVDVDKLISQNVPVLNNKYLLNWLYK
jgi:hypothetical protein